ncbi:MAG: hypothetical protein COA86_01015 [Kangiella sp.]|nr:MAG: hypothetical protein COA86_01015 [Kangiella sp.]
MAYVDLNPIRAKIANTLETSDHTSIQKRLKNHTEDELKGTLKSLAGKVKNRTMILPLKDYIELLEWTGKMMVSPTKGAIPKHITLSLNHLNIKQENWMVQVQNYGSNYYRFVGSVEKIKEKTKSLGRQWLKGVHAIQALYQSGG